MDCTVRTLGREEIDFVIERAADEGWNPGLHDGACFHAADPGGFLVAEVDGQAVGCIGAVSYAGHLGFIGLYIVAPAWRGRGIGLRLWRAGLQRLEGHVVGLDGVPAQQDNYRRSGFERAWQNVRFVGIAAGVQAPLRDANAPLPDANGPLPGANGPLPGANGPLPGAIVPLSRVDFAALCADDLRAFPAPREAFLRQWIDQRDATGLAWLEGGVLRGWGLIRRCRIGHKIAPLLADQPDIASALYAALCASVPAGDAVYLDVPLPNADASALAHTLGLQSVFQTARMFMGQPPPLALERVYGLTSFELG